MTSSRYVVLLRAINVGGRNKIAMAELRDVLDQVGLDDVHTYIQTGNIVGTSSLARQSLGPTIKAGIADHFGHDIEVMVRTAADIARLVESFPYPNADPKSSGVVFLASAFDGQLDHRAFAPDECTTAGADVFVNCPTRFSSTKLTAAWIEKQTGLPGTRRNWATVLKLHEMAN